MAYYEKSNDIRIRFDKLLYLLYNGEPNIETLMNELKASRPTILRMINQLRSRGYIIQTIHDKWGWRYCLLHVNKSPVIAGDSPVPVLHTQVR